VSVDPTDQLVRVNAGNRHVRGRAHRAERRRLARQDLLTAQLAELHLIRDVLAQAITVVSTGWVQHGWFTVLDDRGHRRLVDAPNIHLVDGRPVTGACLVGSIVYAAGGPSAVHSQLVQRTLDLTWHALHEDEREPVRWCPAPAIREAHVRDLTRWNDSPGRTAGQATALLESAVRTASEQIDLLRSRCSVP
jgi:hypothetical protein